MMSKEKNRIIRKLAGEYFFRMGLPLILVLLILNAKDYYLAFTWEYISLFLVHLITGLMIAWFGCYFWARNQYKKGIHNKY